MTCDCVVPDVTPALGNGLIYVYTFDDGMQYVGQTIVPLKERHYNHTKKTLLVDNKIRTHKWRIDVIGEYPEDELNHMETDLIIKLNTLYPNGYNCSDGGQENRHFSEDVRRRLSEVNKNRVVTDEMRRKMSESRKGKPNYKRRGIPVSQETRDKISIANRGRSSPTKGVKLSDEHKRKLSIAKLGKKRGPMSEEHKKKIGDAQRGKPKSSESIAKMSLAKKGCVSPMKGKTHTEESIQKMKESHKGHIPWNKGKKGIQVAWNKGKTFSEESCRKMSESAKKRPVSDSKMKKMHDASLRYFAIRKFFTEVMP